MAWLEPTRYHCATQSLCLLLCAYCISCFQQCRRLHKQEMLELRQQLKTASVSNKGGEKESDRLKKELDKARLEHDSICTNTICCQVISLAGQRAT